MAKTTDVPHELRPFNTLFEKVAYRHGAYSTIFDDFLDYSVACFLTTGDPATANRLQNKYGTDYPVFREMFREWILLQDKMITADHHWYDALGCFYEVIASRWKSSAMGQFFTPPEICELMTMMQGITKEKTGKRERVYDPACGSGRMLLSTHAKAPGNFQYGGDLDPMCAKMTALNMCIHGCVGEAWCMDSLKWEFRFGFYINRHLSWSRVATLERLEKGPSFPVAADEKQQESADKVGKHGQLILF